MRGIGNGANQVAVGTVSHEHSHPDIVDQGVPTRAVLSEFFSLVFTWGGEKIYYLLHPSLFGFGFFLTVRNPHFPPLHLSECGDPQVT